VTTGTWIAYDHENTAAHGPFETEAETWEWIVGTLRACGEIDVTAPQGRETGDRELAGDLGFFPVLVATPEPPSAFMPAGCRHCGEARIHVYHQLLPPVSGFHAFEEVPS